MVIRPYSLILTSDSAIGTGSVLAELPKSSTIDVYRTRINQIDSRHAEVVIVEKMSGVVPDTPIPRNPLPE